VTTAVNSVSELIMIFFSKFYLQTLLRSFALCSGLVSRCFEKATTVRKLAGNGVALKRPITYTILDSF